MEVNGQIHAPVDDPSDTEAGWLHPTASLDAFQWKFLALTGYRTADRVPCKAVTVSIAIRSAALVVQFARSRTKRRDEHVHYIQTQLYPRWVDRGCLKTQHNILTSIILPGDGLDDLVSIRGRGTTQTRN